MYLRHRARAADFRYNECIGQWLSLKGVAKKVRFHIIVLAGAGSKVPTAMP